jgi:hypothetical protein
MTILNFRLLTNLLWYLFNIPIAFLILLWYNRTLELYGDGRLAIVFDLSLFIILSLVCIISQLINSSITENKVKYLKIKKVIFLVNGISIFAWDSFAIIWNMNTYNFNSE